MVVTLTEADDFQWDVPIPASDATETFEPGPFDCNDSATIRSDGQLDVKTITTDIACPSTESNETDRMTNLPSYQCLIILFHLVSSRHGGFSTPSEGVDTTIRDGFQVNICR